MKFKSPTDKAIHIALTTGHTCVIPPASEEAPDGVEIDSMFHREAIAREAVPAGIPSAGKPVSTTPNRTEVITAVLQKMMDGNEEADFKKDGTPDLNQVSRYCGFKVAREEVDALFKTLTESTA